MGEQEKFERLVDPNDVALGYQTQMHCVTEVLDRTGEQAHEPLVDDELFRVAQNRLNAAIAAGSERTGRFPKS